jgi:hypothetical protein
MMELLQRIAPGKASKYQGWLVKMAEEDVDAPVDLHHMTKEGILRMELSAFLADQILSARETWH